MGFFSLFRKRKKTVNKRGTKTGATKVAETLSSMRSEIDQLHVRLCTIDMALKKHDDQLADHAVQMQKQCEKLESLEQKVFVTSVQPTAYHQPMREAGGNNFFFNAQPVSKQFDIERFTEQEKRVLAVFFQNKGIRMSYADVANVLNKSALTVKNQMNQIRQKADLFDCTIGNQSRNLFKLKDDLRIEKYLKVGQSVDRSVSMTKTDQSDDKEAKPVVEYAYSSHESQMDK